jgi:hypothetical protein
MENYTVDKVIVCPSKNVRFISGKLYHDSISNKNNIELGKKAVVILKKDNIISYKDELKSRFPKAKLKIICYEIKRLRKRERYEVYAKCEVIRPIKPLYIPLGGCDNYDESGFCCGHEITEREFIKKYCNGKKPENLKF